jgi:WD40 repeat protein
VYLYDSTLEPVRDLQTPSIVGGVDFSPDGRFLAANLYDGTIRLWETESWDEVWVVEGHQGWGMSLGFFPDGVSLISTACIDGDLWDCRASELRWWDLETRQQVGGQEFLDGVAAGIIFRAGEPLIASASSDGTIHLRGLTTGQDAGKLEGHSGALMGMAPSPDGTLLTSVGDDNTVRLWEIETGQPVWVKSIEGAEVVSFSPSGEFLALGSANGVLRILDVASGQKQWSHRFSAGVSLISFSLDGEIIAVGSDNNSLWLCEGDSGKVIQATESDAPGVFGGIAFSPDGTVLASSAVDNTVRLYDGKTGVEVQVLKGPSDIAISMGFSSDGNRLAAGAFHGVTWLWNAKKGRAIHAYGNYLYEVGIAGADISPDGSLVAAGATDGSVRVWEAGTEYEAYVLGPHSSGVLGVAFSPDGTLLASCACGAWDAQWTCTSGEVWLWDLNTGQLLHVMTGHTGLVFGVTFSPDGALMASSSFDGTVRLWNVATGGNVQALRGHTDAIFGAAFSPDGSLIAAASPYEDSVRVWDVATGQELLALQENMIGPLSVDFSPDGTLLAVGMMDGRLSLWGVVGQ